jgi:diaminopimelate epimerase
MNIDFYKYHGTGNDFVMIDNREGLFSKNNTGAIKRLCDRRFGIGGDGLILLEDDENADFRMVYYNSDGNESTMCGNGGRCIVAFAKHIGLIADETEFVAIDGVHTATISNDGIVSLRMKDVDSVKLEPQYAYLDTGSPHHVEFVEDLKHYNVKEEGAKIRYSDLYGKAGSNANFVQQATTDIFSVRTYERGVEDETLSCGTGAVAVAIACHALALSTSNSMQINVEGGTLKVSFDVDNGEYTNVFLTGPATFVFKGILESNQWLH